MRALRIGWAAAGIGLGAALLFQVIYAPEIPQHFCDRAAAELRTGDGGDILTAFRREEIRRCDSASAIERTLRRVDTYVPGAPRLLAALGLLAGAPAALWLRRKVNSRPCPVCASDVEKGTTVCGACGFDFREAIAASKLAA